MARVSLWRRRETGLLIAVAILAAGVSLVRPDFLAQQNLRDILLNAAVPALVAAGMTAVIVAGGIDISVGSQLAASAVVGGIAARAGWPLWSVALVAITVGGTLGSLNGVLIARVGIPPIVATLATMGGIRGALTWLTGGASVSDLPEGLRQIGLAYWPGGRESPLALPVLVWIAAAGVILVALILARSRAGRTLYAVGGNARSAALSGLPVRRVTLFSYAALGLLVGVAGFLMLTRTSVIQPDLGRGFELAVITAVVVGGTDIFGGRGAVAGSALGTLLLGVISPALTFLETKTQLRPELQPAVQGMLMLAVVLAEHWRHRDRASDE